MTEDKKIFAAPKVRRFARELGANVSLIEGTERKGRITDEDVKQFINNQLKKPKQIPFDLIGELVRKMSVEEWIQIYESSVKK